MSEIVNDIAAFENLLAQNFPLVRSVFDKKFLMMASLKCGCWGNRRPEWFALYADPLLNEGLRKRRINRVERALSWLSATRASTRELKCRLRDSGFQGGEAFFEALVLASAADLPPVRGAIPYPVVQNGSRPELRLKLSNRDVYLEATCLKLQGEEMLPKSGSALTRDDVKPSRAKSKVGYKAAQLPKDAPNVLLVASQGWDHHETVSQLAQVIAGPNPISAIATFSFGALSRLVHTGLLLNEHAKFSLRRPEVPVLCKFLTGVCA